MEALVDEPEYLYEVIDPVLQDSAEALIALAAPQMTAKARFQRRYSGGL